MPRFDEASGPPGAFVDRFIVRVAAHPARAIRRLQAERSMLCLDRWLGLEHRIDVAREEVSEALHGLINRARNQQQRRQSLINLRRDLYHLRRPAPRHLAMLSGPERHQAECLLELVEQLKATGRELDRELKQEIREIRARLRYDLAASDAFQCSLLLSSHSLFFAQARYLRGSKVRARERQIERGLLRYWTRMVSKATPFAAFCTVLPGRLEPGDTAVARNAVPDGDSIELFDGDPLIIRTSARLNKAFAAIIRRALLDDPSSRGRFLVRMNPTTRVEAAGRLLFLANRGGRETFQRLEHGPAFDVVQELLERIGTPTIADLVAALAAHPEVETSPEQAQAFIERLVTIGLLTVHDGIPSQELRWVEKLARFLERVGTEKARACRSLLSQLASAADAYADTSQGLVPERRATLLEQMHGSFEAFQQEQGVSLRVTTPIYEDATADASLHLPRPILDQAESELAQWIDLTSRISILRRDLYTMRHFFESHHGSRQGSRARVPLLELFEHYYKEHYRDHLDREQGRLPVDGYDLANPFGLEPVERLLQARAALSRLLAQRWSDCAREQRPELVLEPEDVAAALGDAPRVPAHPGWSAAVYAAIVLHRGRPARLVLRQGTFVVGFGKSVSRFLDMLPDELQREVVAANACFDNPGEPGCVLAELADDADFNANLHPPLTAEAISYPIGQSRRSQRALLPTELEVQADPDDAGNLWLWHEPTGRRVLPVDTGFMAAHARPPLHRLLVCFNPSPSFTLPLPPGPAPELATPTRVTWRPRIVFGRRLILYRAAWLVPATEYPRANEAESDRDYLVRVERWRRRHGIPRQVLIRFMPLHRASVDGPPPSSERLSAAAGGPVVKPTRGDALKPQLIDFASPLLVGLLGHMAPRDESFLAVLEERLPDTDQMLCAGGEPLVSELVLRMDIPARRLV